MENSNIKFDFVSVNEFSGMNLRKPFDNEILFIALLETIMLEEDSLTLEHKTEIIKDKELKEIANNEVLLNEIRKSTMVYDFTNLNVKLFIRTFITISTNNDQSYVLNFPIKRYLQTGQTELMLIPEEEQSIDI